MLSRGQCKIQLEALVVNDLDVDILGGIPFMSSNDISVRPAKQQIILQDNEIVHYGPTSSEHENTEGHRVRRAQASFVVRAQVSTLTWPGSYVELDTPYDVDPEGSFAIEPKTEKHAWLSPQIVDAVSGKIRILNDSSNPITTRKHEHVCNVRHTVESYPSGESDVHVKLSEFPPNKPNSMLSSDSVQLDPDNTLSHEIKQKFRVMLHKYDNVFSSDISGYIGAVGPFKATVNMGPVPPTSNKSQSSTILLRQVRRNPTQL